MKAALQQIHSWGMQEQAWLDEAGLDTGGYALHADFSNARPDLNDITLLGTNLGGLSSLHANAIDPTHKNLVISCMPRPNAWHVNDLWGYLDEWISESSKNLLAKALGVQFPIALNDPLLGLVQTAIDRIDSNSLIQHARHQNMLLVLAEYQNPLRGREASYSVASTIDRQFGLVPLWSLLWNEYHFPFGDYVQTPLEPTDFHVLTQPTRVLVPQPDAEKSVLAFSAQMRAGSGFTWVE